MARAIQGRHNEEQASTSLDYDEFRLKVSVDYGVYVFLSPKQEGISLNDVVEYSKRLQGYEAYRLVYKREHIIHIYMKFQLAEFAKAAIEGFKSHWETYLHVASVLDMLEAMYAIESTKRTFPLWTATIVDTVGEVRHTNPLAKQTLSAIFRRFGDPKIYDFQWEGCRVRSAQALFSSMAEAFGASIVHGPWVDEKNPCQNFYFRVRIVGGEKEMAIFKQLRIPNAKMVFDMEYFVGGESNSIRGVYSNEPEVVHQQNEYRNYQTTNQPSAQRGTYYRPRGKRSFSRRQFNNTNGRPTRDHAQIQQQETSTQATRS